MSKKQEQTKLSACQVLLMGLGHRQRTKSAFDWSRLIPWIPGVNDIRRRGTAADVRLNPAQMAAREAKTKKIMAQKAQAAALGGGQNALSGMNYGQLSR